MTSAFPSCVSCAHYRKPQTFVLKEDWKLLCIPFFGWIGAAVLWWSSKTPWCAAGQALCGEPDDDAPSCHKMRCFGSCGAEAKLYTPKAGGGKP